MLINDLLCFDGSVFRVLAIDGNDILVIDCIKRQMPYWINIPIEYTKCSEIELCEKIGVNLVDEGHLSQKNKAIAHRRYTLIASILTVVEDVKSRAAVIDFICRKNKISKPTIRKYLCLYLAFQNIYILTSKIDCKPLKRLTGEQKTFRWALNKYYYTSRRNSLKTAYTLMLKEKYCDDRGKLLQDYPPFHRFYYFYRTHKKVRNQIISRDGLSNYQRNYRPLLGDSVREFCPTVGYGMVDSTVCDIYLVNESGQLVGRPILTVCIDAYSSMCMGYSLGWKGGTYSVTQMFRNVVVNKVEHCKKFGIEISADDWNCSSLPATLITDRGREYIGSTIEQLTELGVTIMNLDGYRADLKGSVEKFFDIIQNLYKPHIKGRGVVDVDFQERGARDYRKDACITLIDFEKIIVRCILYYNCRRVIEKMYCTDEQIKPYANAVWNADYSKGNLISVKQELLYKTLLPRTNAKFTRHGLKVGRLHYKCLGFTEEYLRGEKAVVSYEPNDCSYVFLVRNSDYIRFTLIETMFIGKSLEEANCIMKEHSEIVNKEMSNNIQAKIDLTNDILAVVESCKPAINTPIENIRAVRQKERRKQ